MEENIPPVPEAEKPKLENTAQTPVETPKKKKSNKWIFRLVIIVVVILVPVIIYFAKDCEIKNLKEAQQKEIDAVKLQATELVQKTNEANLQNMAKVFSWAIRAAAMQNDTDQMNQLMLELVKIYEYQKVVLLAESGTVVLSTDKKFEGDGLTESFYKEVIGANEVKIYPQKNGDLFVSAPVFGIDSRLGTLVIAYRPTPLEFPEVKAEPEK